MAEVHCEINWSCLHAILRGSNTKPAQRFTSLKSQGKAHGERVPGTELMYLVCMQGLLHFAGSDPAENIPRKMVDVVVRRYIWSVVRAVRG